MTNTSTGTSAVQANDQPRGARRSWKHAASLSIPGCALSRPAGGGAVPRRRACLRGRGPDPPAGWPGHRGGGRERQRQDHGGADARPADQADTGARSCWTASRWRGGRRRHEYARHVQLVLQDPFASLNPVHSVRYHLAGRCRSTTGPAVTWAPRWRRCCAGSSSTRPDSSPTSSRTSCPAASGSGSRSPGRWPSSRTCCSRTSRCRCSTSRSGSASSICSPSCVSRSAALPSCTSPTTSPLLATSPTTILVMYTGEVVERAPSISLTDSPAHPYTQLLL